MEQEHITEVETSLKSLASTFAAVPWAVALIALDGRFLDANAPYCRLVGLSVAELCQMDSIAVTHIDDRIECRNHLARALDSSAAVEFLQQRLVSSSGNVTHVQGSLSAVRGTHGQPLHLIGIFKDVSERNAAGQQLQRRNALVGIAGRVALVGGWTLDLVDKKMAWCDVVATIHDQPLGYSPSLTEGFEFYVPECRDLIRDAVEHCIRDGTPYDLELEILTAKGRRVSVRAIGLAERDAHGTIVRIQGALQDISGRKEKEQAAREMAERLRVTLESITDGFFTLDREWRLNYVNDQARSILGEIDEELLGRNIWTELSRTFPSDFESQVRRALDDSEPLRFEQFCKLLDKWYLFSVFPSSRGLAIYCRDITDARAARRRLELLELCVERLHDMVIITEAGPLDHPGPRIQYVNEAFTRITGFERNEAIGKSPRMLQGMLTDREELDRIRDALVKPEPVHSELVNYTKLGEARWIELDIVPIAFDDEPCSHFVSIQRDISERKRAQQALLDEEGRLRFLNDLSAAIGTLEDPGQVMVEATRRLGEYLHASIARYRESFGSAAEDVSLPDSAGPLRGRVTWPLRRQGIPYAAIYLGRGDEREWSPGQSALIEEVISRYWNVAERMNAESELRENLGLLRIAGRTARLGGWAVDLPQRALDFSDELCEIFELPLGTKVTLDEVSGLCTQESRERMRRAFDFCVKQAIPFDLDLRLRTQRGRDLSVRCTGEAQVGADGAVKRVHGALQDITERERAAAALRSSMEEFRTLTDAMPQIVWSSLPDGRNIYFNQQWVDYTGLTLEESMGHGWEKALHPDEKEAVLAAWNHATRTGGIHSLESRLRGADGEYRWGLIRAVPLMDDDGRIVKWFGTNTDIHNLKNAELQVLASHAALEESERRFSELLRTVDLLSVMLDLEGRITYCNDYLLELTGWQRAELIGRDWYELFLQDGGAANNERIAKIQNDSVESWVRESPIVLRSGEQRIIRWSNSVLLSTEEVIVGTASIGEDITDRLRDQAALNELNAQLEDRVQARTAQLTQAREEADQANKAKSAFLAAMSHEIRTPMNGVIGMIDVLQQTSLTGPQVEMVDLVQESAISLLSIIEDILDFSKIEAGKLSLFNDPMRIGSVIERACALLAPMARKRDVRITLFIDPALPDDVFGDEGRLRQVVTNIVGNAIKFSSGGGVAGKVSIRALRVAPETMGESDDVFVELIISDNGVGMNEATQAQLFTPFAQADPSTTRRFGGTGLGLPICDMLVSLMHGKISVCSNLGQGSVFTVRLPFQLSTSAAAPCEAAKGMPEGTALCCIVGSEQPLRDDLASTLTHAGWNVVTMPDLSAAAMAESVAGLTLWLVLPDQAEPSPEALSEMVSRNTISRTRFVVLGQGGHHRHPRRESKEVWSVDANALSRRTLFEALLLAAQDGLIESDRSTALKTAPRLTLEPVHDAQKARILVAEDNEHNRAVIAQQLRLLGWDAEICNNGLEALDHWRSGDFELLLTDLHMPVMDGYELAMAIRAEELQGRRLPIIALSANGQEAGESRWLASGIDAYLIKPVRLPDLGAEITRLLKETETASSSAASAEATASQPPLDLKVLAEFIGDDPAIIEEVLVAFRRSTDQCMEEFERAMGKNLMPEVAEAAHKLKSSARTVGAERLGQLCADLEECAKSRRNEEVQALTLQFRAECRAVLDFLESR